MLTFYGADWCPDCRRSKQLLDEKGVAYKYINLDEDPNAAAEVERINKGMQSIPTIVFPDGEVLVEPSNEALTKAVKANKECFIVHKATENVGGDTNG